MFKNFQILDLQNNWTNINLNVLKHTTYIHCPFQRIGFQFPGRKTRICLAAGSNCSAFWMMQCWTHRIYTCVDKVHRVSSAQRRLDKIQCCLHLKVLSACDFFGQVCNALTEDAGSTSQHVRSSTSISPVRNSSCFHQRPSHQHNFGAVTFSAQALICRENFPGCSNRKWYPWRRRV